MELTCCMDGGGMVMPLDEHPAVLVGCYLGQVSKLKPAAVGHGVPDTS